MPYLKHQKGLLNEYVKFLACRGMEDNFFNKHFP